MNITCLSHTCSCNMTPSTDGLAAFRTSGFFPRSTTLANGELASTECARILEIRCYDQGLLIELLHNTHK
jgi:hypothetical protein